MKNQHGIECPVSFDTIPEQYNWVAVETNGGVFAYKEKPVFFRTENINKIWSHASGLLIGSNTKFIRFVENPDDASLCLWERPKP